MFYYSEEHHYTRFCIELDSGVKVFRFISNQEGCVHEFYTDLLGNRLLEPPVLEGARNCEVCSEPIGSIGIISDWQSLNL